jgi:hypothetical protein
MISTKSDIGKITESMCDCVLPGKKFTSDKSNGDVTISGSGEDGESTSDCVWSDSDFTQDERDGDVLCRKLLESTH